MTRRMRDVFFNVFLFIYPYCRMRCRYCVEESTNKAMSVSRDDVMRIIGMLGEHGTRRLWLSGGEGTLSPYVLDYIDAAKNVGISPRFSTQDGRRLAELSSRLHDIDIQLSLNGIGGDHDAITQVAGSFKDIEGALSMLSDSVRVEARIIVRPDMFHSVNECVQWCVDRGITRVFLSNISSGGAGGEYLTSNACFSPEEFEGVVCKTRKEFPSVFVDGRYGEDGDGSVCGIYPDGSLYASPADTDEGRVLVGNVFDDGLDSIYDVFRTRYPDYHMNYQSKIASDGTLKVASL